MYRIQFKILLITFTVPSNNMRTLKFKAQPTNAFFATVNQVFGGSSQLPTTAERAVIKSLSKVQTTKQCSAVVTGLRHFIRLRRIILLRRIISLRRIFRLRRVIRLRSIFRRGGIIRVAYFSP